VTPKFPATKERLESWFDNLRENASIRWMIDDLAVSRNRRLLGIF